MRGGSTEEGERRKHGARFKILKESFFNPGEKKGLRPRKDNQEKKGEEIQPFNDSEEGEKGICRPSQRRER